MKRLEGDSDVLAPCFHSVRDRVYMLVQPHESLSLCLLHGKTRQDRLGLLSFSKWNQKGQKFAAALQQG